MQLQNQRSNIFLISHFSLSKLLMLFAQRFTFRKSIFKCAKCFWNDLLGHERILISYEEICCPHGLFWDKRKREEKRVETPTISIVSFEPFIQARSWPTWRRWGENVMLERLLASTTNILSIPRRNGRWKMMGLESGSSRDIWMQDAAPRLWLPVPICFLLYSINFSSLYSFLHFYLSIQISTKFIWCYLATRLYTPL